MVIFLTYIKNCEMRGGNRVRKEGDSGVCNVRCLRGCSGGQEAVAATGLASGQMCAISMEIKRKFMTEKKV